ncbi:MAG TPA: Hsp20/alpha crystallin family protein [Firmicutes bacterium]|jgi:HSP20 family protein|nr:Hsp20/alpha crystallin family protein [Bacillota bacterium]
MTEERLPQNMDRRSAGAISPYGLWGHLERMHREMNRLFEETITPFREGSMFTSYRHSVKEEGANIIISMEMPGIEAQDVEIDAAENYVTIKTEHREEHTKDVENRKFTERSFGRFQSTIPLPKKVRPEAAEASYENGMLKISLPKKEEKRENTFRINVKRSPH